MRAKHLHRLALAIATSVLLVAATGQQNNQALSYQDLVDNVAAGNFAWSGTPLTGSTLIVTESVFVANIANNGSCVGPANRVMVYADMVACRSVTNPISNTTDGWLTLGSTDWPTVSGTPTFVADSSGLGGEPANAQKVEMGAAGTGIIGQDINGGATINTGTTIKVQMYAYASTQTVGGAVSPCTGGTVATATGAAEIEIYNVTTSTIEASGTAAVGTTLVGTNVSATYTTTVSGDVYAVRVSVTENTAAGSLISGTNCSSHPIVAVGNGFATGIGAGN